MASRTQTGSSSWAASIRLRCIFLSAFWFCCRCLKLQAHFGRRCARPRALCLALACAACLGSLTLGYLLAYGSGDAGATVTRHMWGGIALTIGVLLRARWPGPQWLVRRERRASIRAC